MVAGQASPAPALDEVSPICSSSSFPIRDLVVEFIMPIMKRHQSSSHFMKLIYKEVAVVGWTFLLCLFCLG